MIDPIIIGKTIEYTLEDDKDNPTIWELRPLDSMELETLMNGIDSDNPAERRQSSFTIVKYGLVSAKNFGTAKLEFETVKFMDKDRQILTTDSVRQIPLYAVNELAVKIMSIQRVSEKQEKN